MFCSIPGFYLSEVPLWQLTWPPVEKHWIKLTRGEGLYSKPKNWLPLVSAPNFQHPLVISHWEGISETWAPRPCASRRVGWGRGGQTQDGNKPERFDSGWRPGPLLPGVRPRRSHTELQSWWNRGEFNQAFSTKSEGHSIFFVVTLM